MGKGGSPTFRRLAGEEKNAIVSDDGCEGTVRSEVEPDGLIAERDEAEDWAGDRHRTDFTRDLDAVFRGCQQREFIDLWRMSALADEDNFPGLGIDGDCLAIPWAVLVTELDLPCREGGGTENFTGCWEGGFPENVKCAGVALGGVVTGVGDEEVVFPTQRE